MPKKLRKRKAAPGVVESDVKTPRVNAPKKRRLKRSEDDQAVQRKTFTIEEGNDEAAAASIDRVVADGPEDAQVQEKDRRGVVHFGSLPIYMRVEKLRHLMEQFGEVGRVYLAPEDKTDYQRRKRSGGNRKTRYNEGWIEFAKKRIARQVAESLNCTPIGGKKRHNFHRDDMWNIRYLPKFKWHQLKEGAIYNQQARKSRLEQKLSQARRENEFFLENREKARTREKIIARKAAKAGADTKAPVTMIEARFPPAPANIRDTLSREDPPEISDVLLDRLF